MARPATSARLANRARAVPRLARGTGPRMLSLHPSGAPSPAGLTESRQRVKFGDYVSADTQPRLICESRAPHWAFRTLTLTPRGAAASRARPGGGLRGWWWGRGGARGWPRTELTFFAFRGEKFRLNRPALPHPSGRTTANLSATRLRCGGDGLAAAPHNGGPEDYFQCLGATVEVPAALRPSPAAWPRLGPPGNPPTPCGAPFPFLDRRARRVGPGNCTGYYSGKCHKKYDAEIKTSLKIVTKLITHLAFQFIMKTSWHAKLSRVSALACTALVLPSERVEG